MKSKKLLSLLLVAAMSIACLAGCGKDDEEPATTPAPAVTQTPTTAPAVDTAGVTAAKDYLNSMYASKDGSATATASDYTVVGVVKIDGVTYTVDWTVDVKSGVKVGAMDSKKMVTVDVDEKTNSQIDYTLTATLKDANGATASASFKHFVPAYKEFSWNEYVAATEGQTVVVKGVVTAIIAKSKGNSTNALYFQDNDGGYYVYNLSKDPAADLGIKEGMTVQATGKRSTYSGTYEIIEASVEIVDSTVNKVAAADYTDLYKKAESLKDKNLTAKQGLLVSLKDVEIIGIGSDPTYFMFQLGDKQSYVRLSSSVCPITKDEQTAFKDAFTSHTGYLADVTGILTLYDGAFYLSPVTKDAFANYTLPKRTDAEKVAFEKNQLGIPSKVQEDTTLALKPNGTTYTDVAIRYDITGATHEGNTLPLVQTEKDQKITIVATLTCNDAKDTVTIELTVEAKASDLCEAEVLAKAFALADGETMAGTQVLRGKVTRYADKGEYSEQYNNISFFMDVNGKEVEAYRCVGGKDIKIGDIVTVTGTLKNYKGTIEFDKGCTYVKGQKLAYAKDLLVMEKAFALAEGETMSGIQEVTGTITRFDKNGEYSEKYDNCSVWMKVGDYEIEAYRLKGGSDIKVGDVITVTGVIKNYKGTVEFDAGSTYVKATADSTPKTGDASMMIMLMLLIMMAGSFTMMMISKKRAR